MTSFTKALYRRDPAAAEAFHRQSSFEQRQAHGRPGHLNAQLTAGFGRRTPTGVVACAERCTHPGCAQGCTLAGRRDSFLSE